jgi:hypothetical protein
MRDWYVQRFLTFRDTAFHDPRSYFHRYSLLSDDEAIATATAIWERTNFGQSRGKHLADAAARDADPHQGRRSRHRDGGAATALAPSVLAISQPEIVAAQG